jgi:hypothetical protein
MDGVHRWMGASTPPNASIFFTHAPPHCPACPPMFNQSWVRTCVRMQDWAPYTNTEEQGINTFSKGIWKSVYTVEVSTAAITAVVPQIFYSGEYPTSPLQDGSHGGFEVQVRAHMWAATATSGTVSISGDWGGSASQPVQVPAGESDVSHPRTHGTPPLPLPRLAGVCR